MKTILVTYASRTGSTVGVAEAVRDVLAASGARVMLCPMQDVADLRPYAAVVAGSAIQRGSWLPEAIAFVDRHQAALVRMPVATFLVCMALAIPRAGRYRPGVAAWLEPVRLRVPSVSEGLFAGTLDISKVPSRLDRLKFRLSVALGVWTEGDHRDWNAIRAWARELPPLLA